MIRHPEKVKNPINPIKKKPAWIRSKILNTKNFFITKEIVKKIIYIQSAKKQIVQILLNVGAKDMLHL